MFEEKGNNIICVTRDCALVYVYVTIVLPHTVFKNCVERSLFSLAGEARGCSTNTVVIILFIHPFIESGLSSKMPLHGLNSESYNKMTESKVCSHLWDILYPKLLKIARLDGKKQ